MTDSRDPTGKTGKHVDGSGMVRGYAWKILTGYCEWDDILIYDDHVKIKDDHPTLGYNLVGQIMCVWVTRKHPDIGGYGIHHWGINRTFGGMGHEYEWEDALARFHELRGHQVVQSTLF